MASKRSIPATCSSPSEPAPASRPSQELRAGGSGEWGVGNGEWGMGSGEWGVGIRSFQLQSEENMKIESYQDLDTWKLGMEIAEDCYRLTRTFPKEELFGMSFQIRKASSSVPANIAEGYGRESTRDYIRFLQIAQGSL